MKSNQLKFAVNLLAAFALSINLVSCSWELVSKNFYEGKPRPESEIAVILKNAKQVCITRVDNIPTLESPYKWDEYCRVKEVQVLPGRHEISLLWVEYCVSGIGSCYQRAYGSVDFDFKAGKKYSADFEHHLSKIIFLIKEIK